MSIINFSEYIEKLEQKVVELNTTINDTEKKGIESWARFELDKRTIETESLKELEGHEPPKLGLKIPSSIKLNLNEESFIQILNKIYKLY
jgi:hypothetical protein